MLRSRSKSAARPLSQNPPSPPKARGTGSGTSAAAPKAEGRTSSPLKSAGRSAAATAPSAKQQVAPAAAAPQLAIGQRVIFSYNQKDIDGEIAFLGTTKFSQGNWVGIKLDTPTGKNDGCVKGEVYFKCTPLHGIFIRPQNVLRVLGNETKSPSRSVEAGTTAHEPTTSVGNVSAVPGKRRPASIGNTGEASAEIGAEPRNSTGLIRLPTSLMGDPLQARASGEEITALLDRLRSEQEAHAAGLQAQQTAETRMRNLERAVSDSDRQLSTLRSELQDSGSSVARVGEFAAELAASEAARTAEHQALAASEQEVENLRAALEAAQRAEWEVGELRRMEAREAEACRTAEGELQTLAAEKHRHMADLKLLEERASELSERSAECDETYGDEALAMCHSQELRAAAAAYEAQSDCFAAETVALREELNERIATHREQEAQLRAAAAGRVTLLAEVETAQFQCESAEMQAKAERQSCAVQMESAALAASAKELEALKATNRMTLELQKEYRAHQLAIDELAELRSTTDEQQRQQQGQQQHGHKKTNLKQPEAQWIPTSIMSAFCCARGGGTLPLSSLTPGCLDTEADCPPNKRNPELTAEGPGTPSMGPETRPPPP